MDRIKKSSRLEQLRARRQQDWQRVTSDFVARAERSQVQATARQHSGRAFGSVLDELRSKSAAIQRLSATRSASTQSVAGHNRYVASLLDPTGKQGYTHAQYARRRYGEGGEAMLEKLSTLGGGMEDLITDPALMSRSHLSPFVEFAAQESQRRQQRKQPALSPWAMRERYEQTLPTETWYRGLKLGEAQGPELERQGLEARVNRTLAELRQPPGPDAPRQRGAIAQLLSPRPDDTLPKLDEAFDKPIEEVITNRVNKLTRGRDVAPIPMLTKKQFQEQRLEPFKSLSPEDQRAYKSPAGFLNRRYAEYSSDVTAKRRARGKRIDDEAVTQSITAYPEVGVGFGGSDLFGGGTPGPTERVFNYQLRLSPLERLAPQDWVREGLSSGVKVDDRRIANSPRLESITLGKIPSEKIVRSTPHTRAQIPKFEALE